MGSGSKTSWDMTESLVCQDQGRLNLNAAMINTTGCHGGGGRLEGRPAQWPELSPQKAADLVSEAAVAHASRR